MSQYNKISLSGYVYEILGYDENFAWFKINLVGSRGVANVIAKMDTIYLGAYVDLVGYWDHLETPHSFIASKVQLLLPKDTSVIPGQYKDPSRTSSSFQSSKSMSKEQLLEETIMEDIQAFCKSYKVPSRYASVIYKAFGASSLKTLSENPYELACNLRIVSFEYADKIAIDLGIYKHLSQSRIEAGIKYIIYDEAMKGDVSLQKAVSKLSVLLNFRQEEAAKYLEKAVREGVVTLS